jgi:threonine dehydrogenase-like Zn-dependent dehydrogenase
MTSGGGAGPGGARRARNARQEGQAMQGISFAGNRTIRMITVDDPTPGPDEVVLAMRASGLCGSDLHYYRSATGAGGPVASAAGGEPVIAGHEPCGEVVATGRNVAPADAVAGMRAMVHHYWGCSACTHCRSGWTQMCSEMAPLIYGVNRHGGHAPYLKVPARTLVRLPEALSFAAGAAISCGTGTAYFALHRMGLTGRDTVAVFGQGPVGLAATQLAVAQGARVIAIDISRDRLDHAARLGAWRCIDPNADDPVAAIRDLTGGGAAMAMDTSGVTAVRTQAVRAVRPWGVVGLVGAGGDLQVAIADIMRRQVTILTSWTFPTTGQEECARFMAERGVEPEAVFTHRWTLADATEAYSLFDRQLTGKAVFLI